MISAGHHRELLARRTPSVVSSLVLGLFLALPAASQSQLGVNRLDGLIENRGQWPAHVEYGGRIGGMVVAASRGALTIWPGSPRRGGGVRLKFESAMATAGPSSETKWRGVEPLPGVRHFLLGNDPARWRRDVRAFDSITLDAALGVELRLAAEVGQATLLLRPRPGLDGQVRVQFADAETRVGRGDAGSMQIASGTLRLELGRPSPSSKGSGASAPRVDWEGVNALRLPIARDIVDDASAALEWGTFIGGSGAEFAGPIAFDSEGALLVGGRTESLDFPATADAFDTSFGGRHAGAVFTDVFVCKLTHDGAALDYATYLGGSNGDGLSALEPTPEGGALLVGDTASTEFPTTPGAYSTEIQSFDMFVTRLTPDGAGLVFSTLLGGSKGESANSACLLPDESIAVCGSTTSPDYPDTSGGVAPPGGTTAFVTRLLADGSNLVFSQTFGGETNDSARAIAWHPGVGLAVAGVTSSSDFPYTAGAFSTQTLGAFVMRFDDATGAVLHSTALGGSIGAGVRDIEVDALGNIYVAGFTGSVDFPTTPDAFQPIFAPSLGAGDGFISCFDPTLSTLLHSTFLGGNLQERLTDLDIDPSGLVTAVGITNSIAFPSTPGALQTELHAPSIYDAFVSRLSPDLSALHYSTFLGGTSTEELTVGIHAAVDVAPDGRVAASVGTVSPDFPVTPGGAIPTFQGGADVAVVVLDLLPTGVEAFGESTHGCSGPLVMGVTAQPRVGSEAFAFNLSGAPPQSHRGLLLLSRGTLDVPLALGGAALHVDPSAILALLPLKSDTYGYVQRRLRLPADPALVGLSIAAQSFWKDDCAHPGPLAASNGLKITLQP